MTGSVHALLKYLLLSITLTMLGFSVGCSGDKEQQKKSNNGTQPIEDKDSLDAKKESSDDAKKKKEDTDEDENDSDKDEEDEETSKPGNSGSNSDLINQVTGLLGGGGAGGLDISMITKLLSGAGGGAGGLPLDKIKDLLSGGAGGLDPAALSGLLKGLDQKQLQDLLAQLKP